MKEGVAMATKKEIIKQKLAQADFTADVMFGLTMAKQVIYKWFLLKRFLKTSGLLPSGN